MNQAVSDIFAEEGEFEVHEDDTIPGIAILDSLDDSNSRTILATLKATDGALTAQELSTLCGISLTSTYRKLDGLTEAGLIEEHAEVDADGHRRSRYFPVVDKVEIVLGSGPDFEVQLYQAASGPDGAD